jgi:hypothetical protein
LPLIRDERKPEDVIIVNRPNSPAKSDRPHSPTRPPPFYNVKLSNHPIFLRRTTVKPPAIQRIISQNNKSSPVRATTETFTKTSGSPVREVQRMPPPEPRLPTIVRQEQNVQTNPEMVSISTQINRSVSLQTVANEMVQVQKVTEAAQTEPSPMEPNKMIASSTQYMPPPQHVSVQYSDKSSSDPSLTSDSGMASRIADWMQQELLKRIGHEVSVTEKPDYSQEAEMAAYEIINETVTDFCKQIGKTVYEEMKSSALLNGQFEKMLRELMKMKTEQELQRQAELEELTRLREELGKLKKSEEDKYRRMLTSEIDVLKRQVLVLNTVEPTKTPMRDEIVQASFTPSPRNISFSIMSHNEEISPSRMVLKEQASQVSQPVSPSDKSLQTSLPSDKPEAVIAAVQTLDEKMTSSESILAPSTVEEVRFIVFTI